MNSFPLTLDRCACGAYRYLQARRTRKGVEIVYLHLTARRREGKRTETRRTRAVSYVPVSVLGHLGAWTNAPREGDSLPKARSGPRAASPGLIQDPWRDVSA